MYHPSAPIEEIIGKTFSAVTRGYTGYSSDDAIFFDYDGKHQYIMYHEQSCCESVYIAEIIGDLEDLVGTPILEAREDTSDGREEPKNDDGYEPESSTWTFYNFRTIKGSVTIRWYGSSNGYYGETADFCRYGE